MSEDIVAIEQVLNRYCHKLDAADVTQSSSYSQKMRC